jgi:CheY-like chemotaxis protein
MVGVIDHTDMYEELKARQCDIGVIGPQLGATVALSDDTSSLRDVPSPPSAQMTTDPKGRILVIDDDDAVRAAYERLLMHAGYDVRAARSPYEGLESTGDWKPDVILLDLAMPTISGFEGAKVFKKKPNTREAILVAFSGMISDDEVTRFRRIGFDEVLPKPVAAIKIVERIESFMARRAAGGQDNTGSRRAV